MPHSLRVGNLFVSPERTWVTAWEFTLIALVVLDLVVPGLLVQLQVELCGRHIFALWTGKGALPAMHALLMQLHAGLAIAPSITGLARVHEDDVTVGARHVVQADIGLAVFLGQSGQMVEAMLICWKLEGN